MLIFQQEIADGLEESIRVSASIAYASVAEPYCGNKTTLQNPKTIASISDDDLYYVQSILVSSSWNKNDDIFDKAEVWAARNTPEDKPTNLEHDENIIIGHITSNWPITEDGQIIDQDIPLDQLPDKYHILTGSVIYKGFSISVLRDRAEKLIAEIEHGTKYVSMECFFKGFDYGLIDQSTGKYSILSRNDSTAYLTKHLRAYGGSGQHENYKIGRVLRKITFSGKGFVDKPANVDSIIFNKNLIADNKLDNLVEKNDEIINSGVFISQSNNNSETTTMASDKTEVTMQSAETTNTNTEATVANDVVVVEQDTVDTATLQAMVNDYQASNEKLQAEIISLTEAKDAELAAIKAELDEIKEQAAKKSKMMEEEEKSKDEQKKALKAELDAANEVIAAYKMKEKEMAQKEKKMKRQASLIEQGVDSETAATVVEKFESMEDEAFDAMTSLFAGKMPPWLEKIKKNDTNKEEDGKTKKKASEDIADPSVLENVEVQEEVNLGVGGEAESEIDSTRAALVEFVRSRLSKSTK